MKLATALLTAALVFAAPAHADPTDGVPAAASKKTATTKAVNKNAVKRAKITVRPRRAWRGYGYLPGYRPSIAESQGIPVYGPRRPRGEVRYIDYFGNVRYGWGPPRYYRGRWNAGSFGPCWTQTPIGMMWNCGQ